MNEADVKRLMREQYELRAATGTNSDFRPGQFDTLYRTTMDGAPMAKEWYDIPGIGQMGYDPSTGQTSYAEKTGQTDGGVNDQIAQYGADAEGNYTSTNEWYDRRGYNENFSNAVKLAIGGMAGYGAISALSGAGAASAAGAAGEGMAAGATGAMDMGIGMGGEYASMMGLGDSALGGTLAEGLGGAEGLFEGGADVFEAVGGEMGGSGGANAFELAADVLPENVMGTTAALPTSGLTTAQTAALATALTSAATLPGGSPEVPNNVVDENIPKIEITEQRPVNLTPDAVAPPFAFPEYTPPPFDPSLLEDVIQMPQPEPELFDIPDPVGPPLVDVPPPDLPTDGMTPEELAKIAKLLKGLIPGAAAGLGGLGGAFNAFSKPADTTPGMMAAQAAPQAQQQAIAQALLLGGPAGPQVAPSGYMPIPQGVQQNAQMMQLAQALQEDY